MDENLFKNLKVIEMGQVMLDSATPTNCIMLKTNRNTYFFRLSETFPFEQQCDIFRQFVLDINTPTEQVVNEPIVEEVAKETENDN